MFREFSTQCCSDYRLLGVSAVKLDAPPGLISGSPIFLFFQTDIKLLHNFFLISRCLEFNCITFVPHFLFNSCSALLFVLSISHTTWASCNTSILVQNVLSQVHSFRTSAAFQLTLLLDCWFLLRAPCCRIPRTSSPSRRLTHRVFIAPAGVNTRNSQVRSSLPTKTPRIHLMFNLAPSSEWFRPKHTSANGTTSSVWSLLRIER